MAKKVLTRTERIALAAKPPPDRERLLLGWWRNIHCGQCYELLWQDGKLLMRRGPTGEPYEKPAEAFERLLSFGCFTRLPTP